MSIWNKSNLIWKLQLDKDSF